MGCKSSKKSTDQKIIPKEEEEKEDVPAPAPPKPPPSMPFARSRSKINVVADSDLVQRTFYLEKYVEPVIEEAPKPPEKHKQKHRRRRRSKPEEAAPAPPPPAPPPPRKEYILDGKKPEIVFGATIVGNSKNFQAKITADVKLPPKEPGVGRYHGCILFADDAFWYCHNTEEQFNSSYINGHAVKDKGLKRTHLDGHNYTIPRASVRLHSGDVITIGAKKLIKMVFFTEFRSTYWLEYDKFMDGERPAAFSRKELRDMGCKLKALKANKAVKATRGMFRIKKIKDNHDAEMKLRELERQAAAKKLEEQKKHVRELREKMQHDYAKVKAGNRAKHDLEETREKARQKHIQMLKNQMKRDYSKVKGANRLISDIEERRKKDAEAKAEMERKEAELIEQQRLQAEAEEAERVRREKELAEQQRLLREAEEARRIAEQRAALARHRLLGSAKNIVTTNRMQSALDLIREAQLEK